VGSLARGGHSHRDGVPAGRFALERGIGPTDVPEETERRWTVDPDGSIVLLEKGTDKILRRLPLESADPDRLTVRK
jgi:hypothetical protein